MKITHDSCEETTFPSKQWEFSFQLILPIGENEGVYPLESAGQQGDSCSTVGRPQAPGCGHIGVVRRYGNLIGSMKSS
ncbi:hypothetical protein KIN20_035245 [Parelaphostrongylus tenuis]|uniref:Uncharacterized protein n=1 Tax=Parelaphostrongylus tenuis TaxID=148309 RepID=A0AAD5RBJ0_PARTN|nr:hypothetical protein KIN20_035245 [Parelaphostrongylus tenuis]